MNRLVLVACTVAALIAATPAHAATAKSCGGKTLTADGNASVVAITHNGNARPYGCWIPTGKRFALLPADTGDDEDTWYIIGGRYIGAFRSQEGGVESQTYATSWDARKRVELYESTGCDAVPYDPDEDETSYGPDTAVFYTGGGIAYSCRGVSHVNDAKGDRAFEPDGTEATGLAVTPDGKRLYYTVGDTTKALAVG